MIVKGLSFLAFVRPVTLLHRPLAQQGGWEGPPVAEGGLRWGSEPGAAPPWRDLNGRAPFLTKRIDRVVIAESAWYLVSLEDAHWPCTSDFSPQVSVGVAPPLAHGPHVLPCEHRGLEVLTRLLPAW